MFDKPIYDFVSLTADLASLAVGAPKLIGAALSGRVPGALREKVMLTVSGYNGCRYCLFVHTHWARSLGLKPEEIRDLIEQKTIQLTAEQEKAAIEFARKFVAEKDAVSVKDMDDLKQQVGEQEAEDIYLFAKAIYFANLSGNTFDAFLARLKGEGVEDSNPWFEALFFNVTAPLYVPLNVMIALKRLLPTDGHEIMELVPQT